jgi:hypothetical protein
MIALIRGACILSAIAAGDDDFATWQKIDGQGIEEIEGKVFCK